MQFFFQLHIELNHITNEKRIEHLNLTASHRTVKFRTTASLVTSFRLSALSSLLKLKAAAHGIVSGFIELTIRLFLHHNYSISKFRK
jgi:hypothetical protein